MHGGVALVRGPGCRTPSGHVPSWPMDSDRRSWWVMNGMRLIEVLRCPGFKQVRIVSKFHLAKPARPISEGTASGSAR
jgi:hypothetical protein